MRSERRCSRGLTQSRRSSRSIERRSGLTWQTLRAPGSVVVRTGRLLGGGGTNRRGCRTWCPAPINLRFRPHFERRVDDASSLSIWQRRQSVHVSRIAHRDLHLSVRYVRLGAPMCQAPINSRFRPLLTRRPDVASGLHTQTRCQHTHISPIAPRYLHVSASFLTFATGDT